MHAEKNKIKYYQEAAIKSFFLTAARLLSSLALPELTSVFFLHNWLYYIIYTCPTNVQVYCIVPSNFSEHFWLKNVYVSFWYFISIKCKYALQKWWREASRLPCRFWIARKLMHYTNLSTSSQIHRLCSVGLMLVSFDQIISFIFSLTYRPNLVHLKQIKRDNYQWFTVGFPWNHKLMNFKVNWTLL